MKNLSVKKTTEDLADRTGNDPALMLDEAPNFRRLKWDELVRTGDFVKDGHNGFEPWEGPSGFRADAFVKTIYRRQAARPAAVRQAA